MKERLFPLLAAVVFVAIPALAAERHMMQPRVPAAMIAFGPVLSDKEI